MPITDPNQQYFKDGGWGWNGTAWVKLGVVWGYSDRYAERFDDTAVGASDITQTFATVPAGEVWVITGFSAYAKQTNVTFVYMIANCGVFPLELVVNPYTTAYVGLVAPSPIILKAGDFLRVIWYGCILGDTVRSAANGYKMKVT